MLVRPLEAESAGEVAGLAPSEDQPAGSSSLESMKDLLAGGL